VQLQRAVSDPPPFFLREIQINSMTWLKLENLRAASTHYFRKRIGSFFYVPDCLIHHPFIGGLAIATLGVWFPS
jgi:hypothetical protein